MNQKVYHVLFLCTGNSARSIMADAILNRSGKGRFKAYSAGSNPRGEVHPMTLAILRQNYHPISGLRSKGWGEFAGPDVPVMDFVFTLCDTAASACCPVWPGHPITAHWGFEDPAAAQGDEAAQRWTFNKVYRQIENRIDLFISKPIETLDRMSLQHLANKPVE